MLIILEKKEEHSINCEITLELQGRRPLSLSR